MSKENVGFGSNRVIISLPSCETATSVDWGVNLANQFWPLHVSCEYTSQEGMGDDIDVLRNHVAGYSIGTKSKYVWFLSNSIVPPNWAIHRFIEAMKHDDKIMVIAGMCEENVSESTEYLDNPHIYEDENGRRFEVLEVANNNYVNLGCTLIRSEVFEALDEPWFKTTELISSASLFCHKVLEAGYKVTAHTGVLCGKVDLASGKTTWPADAVVAA